jgi:hypothetical protein
VLDVVDGLLEKHADVAVVEGVDDAAPFAFADDEAEVTEDPELVGDGGLFHRHRDSEFADGTGRLAQPCQDAHTAGCGECVHRLRDLARSGRVNGCGLGVSPANPVTHGRIVHEHVFMYSC